MHECPSCDRGFTTRSGLGNHHSSAHGETIREFERRQRAEVDCPSCGKGFESRRALGWHHSHTHGHTLLEYERVNGDGVECPTCGISDFKSPQSMKAHHARVHGESLGGTSEKCSNCDGEIRVPPWRSERFEHNFCSNDCKGEHYDNQADERYGEKPYWDEETLEREYVRNGRALRELSDEWDTSDNTILYWLNKHGIETRDRGHLEGEEHPCWKGGQFPYGEGWTESKRRQVRERDNFECQHCGISQDEHLEKYNRKLAAHHIIPARKFDDPEPRNSPGNLVTLCSKCHPQYEQTPGLRPDTGALAD